MPPRTPPPHAIDLALLETLDVALGESRSEVSVAVIDVTNGRYAGVNASRVWYAASLYKLPLLFEAVWQVERGLLDPAAMVTLGCDYVVEDLGTMQPLGLTEGDQIAIGDAIRNMIVVSDNASANLIGDLVGSPNVDRHMQWLGATSTRVTTEELPTSADDIALLLEAIATGYPSQGAADIMFDLLTQHEQRWRLPSGVPEGFDSVIGNKTGDYEGVAHDAAIVRTYFGTYVIAMLTSGQTDPGLFTHVSSAVYWHLQDAWVQAQQADSDSSPAAE
jgi:beta-lactamase class A